MLFRNRLIIFISAAIIAIGATIPAIAGGTATDPKGSLINVSGSSIIQVKPDVASVTLGADSQASTAKAAQEANAKVMTAMIKALTDLGLNKEDIKTSRFSLNPTYSYDNKTGKSKLEGYRAENRIAVTLTDLNKVGAVIDVSVQAGATNVESISYSLKDVEKAKATALKGAAKDAQARAKILAEAIGLKLTGLKSLSDANIEFTPLVRTMDKAMTLRSMDGAMPSTPIQEGDLEVRALVSAEFYAE